jgi:hypothetical protein
MRQAQGQESECSCGKPEAVELPCVFASWLRVAVEIEHRQKTDEGASWG